MIIMPRLVENWFKSIVHLDSMMPFMMVGVCETLFSAAVSENAVGGHL